jgi:HK97 family phage portal protein
MPKPNILDRLVKRYIERRGVSVSSPPQWLIDYLGGPVSYTGKSVTVESSLTVTAVYAGITILANTISSIPLILYRRLERGKERATSHPLYTLMHNAPNPEHTSMVFRELMVGHLIGWGNFYGQLILNRGGGVREIWPLSPARMEVFRENGVRKYLYTLTDGGKRAFTAEEIFHVPAFGFDGIQGYSPISMASNAIGLAMTVEEYGSKVFANGARPGVILTHPLRLDDPTYERLNSTWNAAYGGAGNAGKTAILEEGMDIKEIGFPPQDAQFLQLRAFQIDEIARLLNIPAWMLGNVDRSTSWGTGIEQQRLGFLTHTIQPWLTRIEQQLGKDLLLESEKGSYFFEHMTEAMLRADTSSRFQAYALAITNGWMTRNEVRERENMNPRDGLDDPLIPLNMGTDQGRPTTDSSPTEDVPPDAQRSTADALTPIYQDALNRCLRREAHDVPAAIKRKKLEEFYSVDHYQFISLQLQPIVQAHASMIRQDVDAATVSAETARMICVEHLAQIENVTDPSDVIAHWHMDELAAQLAARSAL